jgi:hypothetical protein
MAAKSPCKRLKLSIKKVPRARYNSTIIDNSCAYGGQASLLTPKRIGLFEDYLESERVV